MRNPGSGIRDDPKRGIWDHQTAKKRGKIHGGDVTLAYGQAKWPKGMKKIHAGMPAGYKKWYDNVLYCVGTCTGTSSPARTGT